MDRRDLEMLAAYEKVLGSVWLLPLVLYILFYNAVLRGSSRSVIM